MDPDAVHPLLRTGGDSSTEPWIVGHNLILSHAHAVKVYREEFKPRIGGQIGITLNGDWYMPYDDDPASTFERFYAGIRKMLTAEPETDVASAQHAIDFHLGWFADAVYLGEYPAYNREVLGDRLPKFTDAERALVYRSSDFYGMNTYTTVLTKAGGDDEFQGNTIYTFTKPDGTDLGVQAESSWLQAYAPGFRALLNYVWKVGLDE